METDNIRILKQEHSKVKDIIINIILLASAESGTDYSKLNAQCEAFESFWHEHEKKEEEFFKNQDNQALIGMFLEQHQELRGHWKVLRNAIAFEDDFKLKIAFENDGKMLIDNILKHMSEEEKFFDELYNN